MKLDLTNPLMLPVLFGLAAMLTSIILLLSTKPPAVLDRYGKKIDYMQVVTISAFMAILIGAITGSLLYNVKTSLQYTMPKSINY